MSLYAYVATMAITTYLIRVLPLTLFRKPIRSRFIRSFRRLNLRKWRIPFFLQ